MQSAITVELAIACATILTAGLVGLKSQGGMGAGMLVLGAFVASGLCLAGTWLGWRLWESTGGWIGLLVGILLTGVLAQLAARRVLRARSSRFAAGLWFGYCALCIFGYLAGNWIGLLTITVPSIIIFWYGLYRLSSYILPRHDKDQQRRQAFRTLLTYSMGTNYPYYAIQGGRLAEQVPGNVYNQFFAGPGLVIADCDQAAYRTAGVSAIDIAEPGLTFTGMFEMPPKVIDLRPQLRAFDVKAITRDGIAISVLTFVPFRIDRGPQEPRIGASFPVEPRAIYDAVAREPVETGAHRDGELRHEWNVGLVPMVATRILQNILSKYSVDELCATYHPDHDPRKEIIDELQKKAKEEMRIYGIEVLGGGIGDLVPQDPCVRERRIQNWQTEWARKTLLQLSEGEIERMRLIEHARAEAEAEIVLKLGRIAEQSLAKGGASHTALVLRFIDCLGEIVSQTENQWPLPPPLRSTLERLRGEIVTGRSQ